ncbi:DUF7555 family protein [Halorussus lipolyticus]|uniref:DUF7555 family protein n=1 Tax=Halorussus lipolyticus TaxID=3034024 RepID=UPI0023E82661|nr:hypothetical protein [Halorussus sp. DT80]
MSQSTTSRRARQALDAVTYGIAVAAVVFVLGALLGFLLGGGLVTAKFVMFVVGILLFGYATFQLRPDAPWDTKETDDGKVKVTKNEPSGSVIGGRDETTFQAIVQRIPPLSQYSLPPEERLSVGAKLFVASLATLAWSFLMETVFGVVA